MDTDKAAVGNALVGWSAGLEGGTLTNESEDRQSAHIYQKEAEGRIHLQCCGNPYVISKRGALYYDMGQEIESTGATYINGAVHFNVE